MQRHSRGGGMKEITLVSPPEGGISIEALRDRVHQLRADMPEPFSDTAIQLCSDFGNALFRIAPRGSPLQTLGFFLRRAHLAELGAELARACPRNVLYAPRGVVFLIPPGNVPALMAYSWLFAAISGNITIIRLPGAASADVDLIVSCFEQIFSGQPRRTFFIRYQHDDDLTAALSQLCDVRVIWGGDETVRRFQSIPLAPGARDLAFPDRYSLAVISSNRYLELSAAGRDALIAAVYRDLYTFDQAACSSPRLLIWVGSSEQSQQASSEFYPRLSALAASRYRCELANVISKKVFTCEAILDQGVDSQSFSSNQLTVLRMDRLTDLTRRHCGGGLLFEHFAESLNSIGNFISRKDQTLSYFGFTSGELAEFARNVAGKGLDRIVPIGEALTFSHLWDGYDLLQEFVRRVHIVPSPSALSETAAA